MKEEFSVLYSSITNLLQKEFTSHLKWKIHSHLEFIENLEKIIKIFIENINGSLYKLEKKEYYNLIAKYHERILNLIEDIYYNIDKINFDDDFSTYCSELEEIIQNLEETKILTQEEKRFKSFEGDRLFIKLGKKVKFVSYNFSKLPRSFTNIFRKNKKPYKKWNQIVPFKNLSYFWLRDELSYSLFYLINNIKNNISVSSYKMFLSFKEIENSINYYFCEKEEENFDKLLIIINTAVETLQYEKEKLKEFEKTIESEISEKMTIIFDKFEKDYSIAGTIELPARKLSEKILNKKHDKINDIYTASFEGWANTLFGLYDQWRLNEEVLMLKYYALKEFLLIKDKLLKKLNESITPQIILIKNILDQSKSKIENFSGNNEKFIELIKNEKKHLSKTIGEKLSVAAVDTIYAEDIPSIIDDIEQNYKSKIEVISSKRSLIKGNNYGREVKRSEIETFNPKELIEREILQRFTSEIRRIKIKINRQLQLIHNELTEIDQVAEFNLEAAIASINEFDDIKNPESHNIALDGINRAVLKVDEVIENTVGIKDLINNDAYNSVNSFVNRLSELTESEKVFQIKIRIAKAIAQERAIGYKDKIKKFIKGIIPSVKIGFNKFKNIINNYYIEVRKKLGIHKVDETLTTEISDYLAETRNAIEKLPFVYQRLFRNEALADERFYVEREIELRTLKNAYENWKLERFSPVIIYGEKGAGATTLINFYFLRNKTEYEIIRHVQHLTLCNTDELIDFFAKLFGFDKIENEDDLVLKINNLSNKKIVIIENLQNFFLRKVNGFNILETVFSIFSRTNKKIFWITTCTIYAWEYFQKTLKIHDFFGYPIKLEQLEAIEINNVILKRHRVSGFNLEFQPSENDLKNKNFIHLNFEERQEFLKKKYFTLLNKIVRSNITLAQLFWLRSTVKVEDNTIIIASLRDLDFSFMKSLSDEKIFVLASFLLHEGMSEKDYLAVFNQNITASKLTVIALLDDGILIEEDGIFYVNPLLYRHTVDTLKSKNILH